GEAIPICDIDDLDGYTGDNTMSMGATGDPECDTNGEGAINNAIWFSFVAGNTSMEVDYILTNCVLGPDGCIGDVFIASGVNHIEEMDDSRVASQIINILGGGSDPIFMTNER
ncbi:hypothetical protein N9L92_03945, partial [Saprospiraceae bacterium]|nr:hypothetical protein [Saprospiraceae bacterium]